MDRNAHGSSGVLPRTNGEQAASSGDGNLEVTVSIGDAEENTGYPFNLTMSDFLQCGSEDESEAGKRSEAISSAAVAQIAERLHSSIMSRMRRCENESEGRNGDPKRSNRRLGNNRDDAVKCFFAFNYEKAYELTSLLWYHGHRGLGMSIMRVECEIRLMLDGCAYENLCDVVKTTPLHDKKVEMFENMLTSTSRFSGLFAFHQALFQKRKADIHPETLGEEEIYSFVCESSELLSKMGYLLEQERRLSDVVYMIVRAMREEVLKCRFKEKEVKHKALEKCQWCLNFCCGYYRNSPPGNDSVSNE